MSSAARKARKRAGQPAPIKAPKVGTPLLERTVNAAGDRAIAERFGQALATVSEARLRMQVK